MAISHMRKLTLCGSKLFLRIPIICSILMFHTLYSFGNSHVIYYMTGALGKPRWNCTEQDRQCTYNVTRGIRATTVAVGKQYYIFLSVCVCGGGCPGTSACARARSLSYPARNTCAPYCHLWSLSFHHIFRHNLGKQLLNIKCVFWFSLQLLSEKFLILSRIQRDIVINVKTCSCKVSVILVRF